MPRMTFEGQGYHNATDEEVEELKKAGWSIITDAEFKKVLEAKRAAMKPVHVPEPERVPVSPAPSAARSSLPLPKKA
jgi:hypothetical protein